MPPKSTRKAAAGKAKTKKVLHVTEVCEFRRVLN